MIRIICNSNFQSMVMTYQYIYVFYFYTVYDLLPLLFMNENFPRFYDFRPHDEVKTNPFFPSFEIFLFTSDLKRKDFNSD